MTKDELKEIIEKHEKWLKDRENGERANLYCANLHCADLSGVNLRYANLCGVNLSGANLRCADLCGATLCGANLHSVNLYEANLNCANLSDTNLSDANLRCADLCGANLCSADLYNADLCGANLCSANLYNANLWGANIRGASLCGANLYGVDIRSANLCNADLSNAKNVPFMPMACPDSGAFTAWKTAHGFIVKLFIPEDARRSSATGRKCRCDKAVVVAIEKVDGKPAGVDEVASDYNYTFIYKVGETVTEPNFCEDRFNECAAGIHFFINRQEAVNYRT